MLQVKAKFRDHPWDHLYLESVFTEEVYDQIVHTKPMLKRCKPLPGYADRMVWPLKGATGFWGQVRDAITHPDLMDSIAKRLGVTRKFYPKVAVCRDLPGYIIPPHVDATFKTMTFLVYIPDGLTQKLLGTRLLKKEDGEFTFAKQVGFFPNVGIAFKPSPGSWHEVPMTMQEDGIRDTLHVCCFDTPEREWL